MPVFHLLSSFVDFDKTKAAEKALDKGKEEPLLKFIKIKSGKSICVRIVFNKALFNHMKSNKITTFKMMFDEKDNRVAIVYNNLKDSFSFLGKIPRANGSIEFMNAYVTATMLEVLEEKKAVSLTYKPKFESDSLAYICKLAKVGKGKKDE